MMDPQPESMPPWETLDYQTQSELALLTVDSAPWAMDQKLHDTAALDTRDGFDA